jgi:hypothetical protein
MVVVPEPSADELNWNISIGLAERSLETSDKKSVMSSLLGYEL